MYTKESIDAVKDANIVEVIEHFLELKKEGANYKAKSPFTEEKTPSFVVSPVKQIFKCFSTGMGGDAIKFVQEYKRVTFIEAVKAIAEICNITLQEQEVSEERKKYIKTCQSLKALNDNVAKKYAELLNELPANHWCTQMLSKRGYTKDSIIEFQLGYAPGNLVSKAVVKNGKLELAKETGLVKTKSGTSYDFFKDRLMFPIHNQQGQVIAFGGRRSNAEEVKKYAKYLNTSDSQVYNKSNTLYGLHQAKKPIEEKGYAVVVEGYTDVITLHQHECDTAVATCGTALTKEHALQLRKICNHVILFRDGDKAGLNALLKKDGDIDTLVSVGIKVSVCLCPDEYDPDSLTRLIDTDFEEFDELTGAHNISDFIQYQNEDGIYFKANYHLQCLDKFYEVEGKKQHLQNQLKSNEINDNEYRKKYLLLDKEYEKFKNNPVNKSEALNKTIETLRLINDEIVRKEYVKEVAKLFKQSSRTINTEIKRLVAIKEADTLKKQKRNASPDFPSEQLGLPKGAVLEQFIQDRFAIVGNSYHFQGKDGFFKGTNHKITPLFHIYGSDNKRLCEVVNELGHKRLIDFESKDFINFNKIQEKLIEEGFFTWLPNVQTIHFKLVAQKILNDFITAYELKTLGWTDYGFFAFADGVFFNNEFQKVNKYGIIHIEKESEETEEESEETEEESEYQENVKYFYSPAFSEMYKRAREGDDPYENDRSFVYKKASISLSVWMKQMQKVYGDKGNIAIAFAIASLFRDFFIQRYSFFPHLFLSGEKGSGKSKFGDSIANLFTYKLAPFDLNSGTIVGFYRRLARIKNVPVFFEEFHDKIDERMFQSLKGAYDGRGREKGNMTSDNRTSISKINSSCILAGQYLSSRDDNSLTSRSIINHFIKPQENFTDEQIADYNLLKKWEDEGLSSLLLDVLQYRELFEQNFHKAFADNSKKFKKDLSQFDYQERMLMNYNAIYTPVALLYSRFTFPFTLEDFYTQCKNGIIDNSDLIVESEGMAEFWRVLEHLFKRNIIREGFDFVIDTPADITINPKKNTSEVYKNSNRNKILFLRLSSVHQEYHLEASKRDGVDVIGESTIRNYFKSKKYFISAKSGHRFKDSSSSCYLFNYDMMRNQGILNLDRLTTPTEPSAGADDEIPFV